nr:inorganic pyrophosphatase {EC 3.6.1.1} [Microcystis aeruginosa, Peptide Partial, 29 aa] [Microcystis aeruginosa]
MDLSRKPAQPIPGLKNVLVEKTAGSINIY